MKNRCSGMLPPVVHEDAQCRMPVNCQHWLQVASMSRVRGNVVLHFLAGGRALGALSDMLLREARLNAVRFHRHRELQ